MATLTVIASPSYVHYWGASDESYATVHNADDATQVGSTSSSASLGQLYLSSTTRYRVFRWGVQFVCYALPPNAHISVAKVQLYAEVPGDNSAADFDVTIVKGDALDFPPVVADYGQLLGENTSYGTWNTSNWPGSSAYVDIDLNATGIAEITTGIVQFGLKSSEDIGVSAPIGLEYGQFGLATNPPRLVITYAGGETRGVIAVVETRLHYVDAYGHERGGELPLI